MSKEVLKIGTVSNPRFEFRTFGQNFDNAARRMARFSVPIPESVWQAIKRIIGMIDKPLANE